LFEQGVDHGGLVEVAAHAQHGRRQIDSARAGNDPSGGATYMFSPTRQSIDLFRSLISECPSGSPPLCFSVRGWHGSGSALATATLRAPSRGLFRGRSLARPSPSCGTDFLPRWTRTLRAMVI